MISGSDIIHLNNNFQLQTEWYRNSRDVRYYMRFIGSVTLDNNTKPTPLILSKPISGFVLPDFPIDTSNIKKIIHQNNAVFVLSKNGVLLCLGAIESAVKTHLQNELMSNAGAVNFLKY